MVPAAWRAACGLRACTSSCPLAVHCVACAPEFAHCLLPVLLSQMFLFLLFLQVMKMVAARPDVLLLAVNFDENKAVVKALGVKVRTVQPRCCCCCCCMNCLPTRLRAACMPGTVTLLPACARAVHVQALPCFMCYRGTCAWSCPTGSPHAA